VIIQVGRDLRKPLVWTPAQSGVLCEVRPGRWGLYPVRILFLYTFKAWCSRPDPWAEYLGNAWLVGLFFYSRGSGSVLREPSRIFAKVFATVLLPHDFLAGHVIVLVFSQFAVICLRCWGMNRIWPPSRLWQSTLGLFMSIINCAAVVAAPSCHLAIICFQASTTWKAGKSTAGTVLCFLEGRFLDLFCFSIGRYPSFDPCCQQWPCKCSYYDTTHQGLSETFPSCKVRNSSCTTRIQVRNKKTKCRAVIW